MKAGKTTKYGDNTTYNTNKSVITKIDITDRYEFSTFSTIFGGKLFGVKKPLITLNKIFWYLNLSGV